MMEKRIHYLEENNTEYQKVKDIIPEWQKKLTESFNNGALTSLDLVDAYTVSKKVIEKYTSLDKSFVNRTYQLAQSIIEYHKEDTREKPLNILLDAGPGIGKSHFVRCLCEELNVLNNTFIEFNMSSADSFSDLEKTIHAVQNISVKRKLPVLFLDEFDSNPRFYAFLLPILAEGRAYFFGERLELGRIVIFLAGSSKYIAQLYNDISSPLTLPKIKNKYNCLKKPINWDKDDIRNYRNMFINPEYAKLPDLVSRINGGLFEITDLEKRRYDKVLIAVAHLQKRFPKIKNIPFDLLRFIYYSELRFAARSIEHIIYSIPLDAFEDDKGMLTFNLQHKGVAGFLKDYNNLLTKGISANILGIYNKNNVLIKNIIKGIEQVFINEYEYLDLTVETTITDL
jgi:hypothetical protein